MKKPKYRLHKGSGQALVEWQGQRKYLGVYGSPESREAFRRFCARGEQPLDPEADLDTITPGECTVAELVIVYLRWAQRYYADHSGATSREYQALVAASRPLVKVAGAELIDLFRPRDLRRTRDEMIAMGWSTAFGSRCGPANAGASRLPGPSG